MTHYLWRAVDQHGDVLDILGTSRRDPQAATRFFPQLLKGWRYVPRVLVTDKLTSYGPAHHRLIPGVEHRRWKYLDNRAENFPQPTDTSSGPCAGSTRQVQRSGFCPRSPASHPTSSPSPPAHRRGLPPREGPRFSIWNEVTGLSAAA